MVDDLKIAGKSPVLQHVYNMSTTSCRHVRVWLTRLGHAATDMSTTCLQLVRVVDLYSLHHEAPAYLSDMVISHSDVDALRPGPD